MALLNEYLDDGKSFFQINPLSINPDYLIEFSLYERFPLKRGAQYRFRCLLFDPTSIPRERLMRLLSSWDVVYIHKNHKKTYDRYVKDNLEYILGNDAIDVKNKARTFMNVSGKLIKETFENNFNTRGLTAKQYGNIKKLVYRVIGFISDINSLKGFADLIGHDYETHTHSIKVGWLIATFINANKDLFPNQNNEAHARLIIHAAVVGFLHDIGKIRIPKNILNKRGKLSNLEYVMIQAHTAYSVSLLFETNLPKNVMQGILYHHENEDGSGYPCGITNKQIPLMAKIVHVADVFDALTSRRPYKEPKTPFEALRIMIGENPYVDVLHKFEKEIRENRKTPVIPVVRNKETVADRQKREKEIVKEEAAKRVEVRTRLRDRGMSHCFDQDIMKRFIITINKSESFDLSDLMKF